MNTVEVLYYKFALRLQPIRQFLDFLNQFKEKYFKKQKGGKNVL